MRIKECGCGLTLTTKNVKRLGTQIFRNRILFFNCPACHSTGVVVGKLKPQFREAA